MATPPPMDTKQDSSNSMGKTKFIERLLNNHKKHMREVEKDNPVLTVRAKLVSQERTGDGFLTTFEIVNASSKVKLNKMIEEKVCLGGRRAVMGRVVGAEENRVVISLRSFLKETSHELLRDPNYNNRKLLEAAESFIKSGKVIPECLYSPETVVSQHTEAVECPQIQLYNTQLNKSQEVAVRHAILGTPFKILGPPGTGKTETIVEIISQLLCKGLSVLVCGPSNTSVDNIIIRFQNSQYAQQNDTSFYRLGSSTKGLTHLNLEAMADEAVQFMESEGRKIKTVEEKRRFIADRIKRKSEFIKGKKEESRLVFSTLFSSLKESHFFDVCIVDEACQASELECFMGVVKAKRFILAGDPHQLAPQTTSLYESITLPEVILNVQYRMPAGMIAFSNKYFYKNEIESPEPENFLFNENNNIILIDTSFCGYSESTAGNSKMNVEEAGIIIKAVEWIRSLSGSESSVGVIVPYSAQVVYLRNHLENCSVNTVDGFQGQERDFIVIGLVRSNYSGEIGFLSDKRRINVAITRAKKGLVVVGDVENFKKSVFFGEFFKYLEKHAYVVDPETFCLEC